MVVTANLQMKKQIKPIVITPGEPAGVGPDLLIQLAQQQWPVELVACADPDLLRQRAKALNLPLTLTEYSPIQLMKNSQQVTYPFYLFI